MRRGFVALPLVALTLAAVGCASNSTTGHEQTADKGKSAASTTRTAKTTPPEATTKPAGSTKKGGGGGSDSYCMTAAGVVSLQADLLIAVASGDPAGYKAEVDAVDSSAAPAEIAHSIKAIHDIDVKFVSAGKQASASQGDLNSAMKPVAEWLAANCPH